MVTPPLERWLYVPSGRIALEKMYQVCTAYFYIRDIPHCLYYGSLDSTGMQARAMAHAVCTYAAQIGATDHSAFEEVI